MKKYFMNFCANVRTPKAQAILAYCKQHNLEYSHWSAPVRTWCVRADSINDIRALFTILYPDDASAVEQGVEHVCS